MSYQMPSDASLLQQADTVVVGRVLSAFADPADPSSVTLYQVAPEQLLKGAASGVLTVRVPGGVDPGQPGALVIPGVPHLAVQEQMLLFLKRRSDGSYGIDQFALGAFHVRSGIGGLPVAVRDLDGGSDTAWLAPDAAPAGMVRDLARFTAWIAARAAGSALGADYWADAAPAAHTKFTYEGTPPVSWAQFAQQRPVTLWAAPSGQAGVPGGGFNELRAAIKVWNDDSTSAVQYVYGGIDPPGGGLNLPDGLNQVLFNDPHGDIDGSYDCANGGVVAYTSYRYGAPQGLNLKPLTEVDIVVQDGAGCLLAGHGNADMTEMFAHELGHSLGLGHSCGDGLQICIRNTPPDQAVMRATLHSDGRGAALGSDDRAGIAALYPDPLSQSPAPDPSPQPPAQSLDGGGGSQPASTGSSGGGAVGGGAVLLLLSAALLRRRHGAAIASQGGCGQFAGAAHGRSPACTGADSGERRAEPPGAWS